MFDIFDFNFNGDVDAVEMAMGCMVIDELEKEQAKKEFENELLSNSIDPDEFEFMDEDEQEELLSENGIDSYDFDI